MTERPIVYVLVQCEHRHWYVGRCRLFAGHRGPHRFTLVAWD